MSERPRLEVRHNSESELWHRGPLLLRPVEAAQQYVNKLNAEAGWTKYRIVMEEWRGW